MWGQLFPVISAIPAMKIMTADNWVLRASINVNLLSWGENITVSVGQHPQGSVVHILSECAFPLQLIDFGRNKKNVRRIAQGLEIPVA